MPASDPPVTSLATYRIASSRPLPPVSLTSAPSPGVPSEPSVATLLDRLAQGLARQGIAYCQWKGYWSAHRWSAGLGDVDLLVDHDSMAAFRRVVEDLGFKLAYPSGQRQIPGVESYFGHDPQISRLLHLHVHYRLLLGEYWKPVYRIPIERLILERSVPGHPFRIPAPTHRYLVFVLRMMLRQVGRPHLSVRTDWFNGIQIQLASLEAGSDRDELRCLLQEHLSPVDLPFFERCARSLQGGCGVVERSVLPWQLHRRLRAHARRASANALGMLAVEKLLPEPLARLISDRRSRLAGGGLVVALAGAEGAGTSTCGRELDAWLSSNFPTMRANLENPQRSLLTRVVNSALKLEDRIARWLQRGSRRNGPSELLRHVCTARDRYHLYEKVRRFAVGGGIALCERYPNSPASPLLGPAIPELLPREAGIVGRLLRAAEASYFVRIMPPDVSLVLKIETEPAVGGEPADDAATRARSTPETATSSGRAQFVDASQPLPEVIRGLKSVIWSRL